MKKRTTMLALLLATGAGTCLQAQEKLTQFKVRDAITVRTPIMNDSINPKGEKYADKDLLKTPVVLDLADAPFQVLSTDTAGVLSFPKAEKDHSIYLLETSLRAERFMTGKLKVTSPARWEIFINGESKMSKKTLKTAYPVPQPAKSTFVWNPKPIMKSPSSCFPVQKIKQRLP